MTTRPIFRTTTLLSLLTVLLAGCATRNPDAEASNPFMHHWQEQAIGREGFSPSVEDLQPEPRVLMQEKAKPLASTVKKGLPASPVTLKVQDSPVPVVLRMLAKSANVSLLISPAVTGFVSLDVVNEPWSDVFKSVLAANGLEYRWTGRILQVLTIEEKKREFDLAALNNEIALQETRALHTGPLGVSVVNVRYSDATELQKTLAKFLAGNPDAVIEIDQHNNALIVQATDSEQTRIISLIEHLDRPRPQVQLRAHIIETTKEKARELGMQWGGNLRSGTISGGDRGWIGTGSGAGTAEGAASDVATGILGSNLGLDYSSIVNGTGAGKLGFALGRQGGNILEAQLNMMEKEGVLNILSSPSITTLDNKMAYTENGEKVPYVSRDSDGNVDVKFEDAVLRLEMTPNVIDGANLKLKVLIKKDEVDGSRAVEGNPFIVKKQTETTVMVRSGETIVISGLTKERGVNTEAGVPGARDLPGGRYVFGSTNRTQSMEEVLIFITPTILPTRTKQNLTPTPLPPSPSPSALRDVATPVSSAKAQSEWATDTVSNEEAIEAREAEASADAQTRAKAAAKSAAQPLPAGSQVLDLSAGR